MTIEALSENRSGFTLIEVLVAMIILSIGLLGLEALGIGAARSVALAERQSEYAIEAGEVLERTVQELRGTGASPSCTSQTRPGYTIDCTVTAVSNSGVTNARQVTVTVTATATAGSRPQPLTLSSYVFLPSP